MNSINYDKLKSHDTLRSQLEIIGYISDKLTQQNITCILIDEFAAEFYTGSFYRAKYITLLIDGSEETADKLLKEMEFIKKHGLYILDSRKMGFPVYIKTKRVSAQFIMNKFTIIKCRSGAAVKIITIEEMLTKFILEYSMSYSFKKSEQIISMLFNHYDNLDLDYIYSKFRENNITLILDEFIEKYKQLKRVAENENN